MEHYTVLFYLETTIHVSGGTITHHQEGKQLYLQHLAFVTLLLLPVAELVLHSSTNSLHSSTKSSTKAAGSSNGVTNTRCCRYNSNKSPTRRNSFQVYYPDVYLRLNMFRALSRPLSGAQ